MNELGTGGYDDRLWCQFYHTDLKPTNIRLPLGVSGVTWEYKLNTSVIDTYGGQVIQILGVSISNLQIKGQFAGPDPTWGAKRGVNNGHMYVLDNTDNPNPRFSQYEWLNEPEHPWANGIMQLSDWFRQYFELTTQGGKTRKGAFEKYNQTVMKFIHPGRGWEFFIRPTSFPQVRLSNDNIAPEWVVEADYVEEFEPGNGNIHASFVNDVEEVALSRLNELKVGVGFQKKNPFSEYLDTSISNTDLVDKIIKSYQDSVDQGLSDEEIDQLIEYGFSYPGSAFTRAGLNPKDFD
jgi:hypothetical protein